MSHLPYNPLAKVNLGESVANALLNVAVRPLGETSHLIGAGVYVIYYTGGFPHYAPIAARNLDGKYAQPIYVGKAVPKGARKGGLGFDSGSGKSLRDRLGQHASSIADVSNLELSDFYYRALTVEDIWIPLGENVIIERYQPLWNRVIDGFGNKTPGKGRATQKRSSWDVLHPGRSFVDRLNLAENSLSADAVLEKVLKFHQGTLSEAEQILPQDEEGE